MILSEEKSWPPQLLAYLGSQFDMLMEHAVHDQQSIRADLENSHDLTRPFINSSPHFQEHESALERITELLRDESLRGWHCTRLTDDEATQIREHGMFVPSLQQLIRRIDWLLSKSLITAEVAAKLRAENEADSACRRDRIWFCFFTPKLAGESGISSFCRYWGGEALYRSHPAGSISGQALQSLGTPSIVEVNVPIKGIEIVGYLSGSIVKHYLRNRGLESDEDIDFEGFSVLDISAKNIIRVVRYRDRDFQSLTDCESWTSPLA